MPGARLRTVAWSYTTHQRRHSDIIETRNGGQWSYESRSPPNGRKPGTQYFRARMDSPAAHAPCR
ncbi:hypothetical protein ARMGADRAFT_1021532 [Armillaria gallica]|uniref:Uncharacterized protein n=1 Tax=Armillaria gallica TaxID=47427 RepID=A0A2H3C8N6_ARMGA|nr:hypothetical protein ARMGADRAFT_1021532 [Armillaria gallica]